MARLGRSQPASTRLRRPVQADIPPRSYAVGVAGSQERARPVNRAVGEVRTARGQDTALAIAGRVHTRLVGGFGSTSSGVGLGSGPLGQTPLGGTSEPSDLVEADQALPIAGRKHRRNVGRASESNSVEAVTRKHRRDVGLTVEFDAALPAFDKAFVSDAVFAAAIESTDRQPTFTLRADWNRDDQFDHPLSDLSPLVEQVTVERELQGDLPPEVGQIEGFAAASLKATLSGRWPAEKEAAAGFEDLSPAQVLAPYREDSPLYGAPLMQTPVQLDTGFVTDDGVREDRRFTGTVRRISPRSGGRTVALDAMDSTFRLRQPITLPGVALYRYVMENRGPDVYRHRINTQWLVDYILRRNGIFASPPCRDDAILSVTGHGSMIPEVGWGGAPETVFNTYRGATWFTQAHPYGMAYEIDSRGRWWTQSTVTANAGTGVGLSMISVVDPGDGVQRECFRMHLTTNATWWLVFGHGADGRPYIGLDGPAANDLIAVSPTGWTPVTSSQFLFIGAHVSFAATSMTVRWRIGGQLYTTTVTIPTRATNAWSPGAHVEYVWLRPFTNLQMWQSSTPPAAGPWQGEVHTPEADLDPGGNELTGLPEMIAADGWEVVKEICAAEASRFQFTESGRPQFRTRIGDTARGTPAVSETIPANKNLSDLVANTDEASIRNIINLKTPQVLVGEWGDYYKSPTVDAFDTPPGLHVFDVELPSSAYEIPPPRSTFGARWDQSKVWDSFGGAGFIYYETNQDWQEWSTWPGYSNMIRCMGIIKDDPFNVPGSGTQIRVVRLSPWRMRIMINNEKPYTVRFATRSVVESDGKVVEGEPALIIPARIVESGEEQLETFSDPDSIALYGASSFDIGGSGTRWRQIPDGLRGLADKVLETTAHPVPTLDAVDVAHDPRRRIGQRITLADPDGLGTVTATIVGLSTTYSSSGATDRITVRPIAAPGR